VEDHPDELGRPPLSTMNREIGREQLTGTPSLTRPAARRRVAGVMKFSVPSWSSAPQRSSC
jgi:hypothetical protein